MKKPLLLLCFSVAAASSQAVVTFNTFGPGNSAKANSWGFGDLRDTRIASQFTASVTGTLNSMELGLQRSGTTADATISLFQDSGDDIGSLIKNFTTQITQTGAIKTFTNSDPSIQLIAGNKYWIEAKTTDAGSGLYTGWSINNQGVKGLIKFGQVLGSSPSKPTSTYKVGPGDLTAFRVDVTPVPEPATLLSLGLFASMTALRRRKVK